MMRKIATWRLARINRKFPHRRNPQVAALAERLEQRLRRF